MRKDRVKVGHILHGLHEVEAKTAGRAVDDRVTHVVELVAHDQEEKDDGDALGELFQKAGGKRCGRLEARPRYERANRDGLPEALGPDDEAGRNHGAPGRGSRDESPWLGFMAVEET